MNNPFVIGFLFGFFYEFIRQLRLRFGHTKPGWRVKIWTLIVGFPSFLAFSFAVANLYFCEVFFI